MADVTVRPGGGLTLEQLGGSRRRHRRENAIRWGLFSAAVMSVVAFFYYVRVVREMWFHSVPDSVDPAELRTPLALNAAIGLCAVIVLLVGVYPQVFARIGELAAGG